MRKLYIFSILFFSIFLLISCQKPSKFATEIALIEEEDDNLCIMQGLNIENSNTEALYWKCRLQVLNQRISNIDKTYGYSVLFRAELKKLKKIILENIEQDNEQTIAEIKGSIGEKEHKYCLFQSQKNNDNNLYFECIEEINKNKKDEDIDNLFYTNEEFMGKYVYLDFVSDEEAEERRKEQEVVEVDSECIEYVYNKEKLDICLASLEKIDVCLKEIPEKINARILNDRLFCQKVSLDKYPDNFIETQNFKIQQEKNKKKEEESKKGGLEDINAILGNPIQEEKKSSPQDNINALLGLPSEQEEEKPEVKVEEKKEEVVVKEDKPKINLIKNTNELFLARQKEYNACYTEILKKTEEYEKYLKKMCKTINDRAVEEAEIDEDVIIINDL